MAAQPRAISMARYVALLCVSIVAVGCSVIMAMKQPDKKDLEVLEVGTHRSQVIAELGTPTLTEEDREAHHCHDTYFFTQGYSFPARAGRTLFHTAADLFTVGLWELVGTPAELYFDGTEVRIEVLYDNDDRVDSVCVLSGQEVVSTGRIVSKAAIERRLHEDRAWTRLEEEAPPPPTAYKVKRHPRARIGLLPVLSPKDQTIYRQGFREGFNRLYLDPVKMGSSNTPGDIILLGAWILSIPVGVIGGIAEDMDDPSPEAVERFAAALRKRVPEFDLASVVREEISERLEGLQETLLSDSPPPVESVVPLASGDEASDEDLDVLLEVEIEKIVISGGWDENPEGPIVLYATARLLDPGDSHALRQNPLQASSSGSLDWEVLEDGDVEGFGLALTNELQVAAERLADDIVNTYWTYGR